MHLMGAPKSLLLFGDPEKSLDFLGQNVAMLSLRF